MDKKIHKQNIEEFCMAISNQKMATIKEFLTTILTDKELEQITMRWLIARMLYANFSWQKIEKITGASSATIANVNRIMKKRNAGLYVILDKM